MTVHCGHIKDQLNKCFLNFIVCCGAVISRHVSAEVVEKCLLCSEVLNNIDLPFLTLQKCYQVLFTQFLNKIDLILQKCCNQVCYQVHSEPDNHVQGPPPHLIARYIHIPCIVHIVCNFNFLQFNKDMVSI